MIRQLTAMMFTDMVGYTALMQENERKAKIDSDRQRGVIEAAVGQYDGRILQFYGDGTLSVFRSAIQAVQCAVRIQADLGEEPRVPLRIGVHTGDVVHDADGVFGDGVNVASRIQTLAVPGSVLISEKVFDEVKNQPDIRTQSLGLFQLKNVRRRMEVYAVTADHLTVPRESQLTSIRDQKSVAVLPFINMSSNPENEFFSDGITEEIINALTRVNGLQVTARTSSFAFKGLNADIREIAGKLGVRTILEGSVRRDGNRVRIAAQLIGTEDGYHIFSEVYDRGLDDIFATQDEIARTIVSELESHFTGSRAERTTHGSPHENHEPSPASATARTLRAGAHQEYLLGRFHFSRWTPQGASKAIAHYERAAEMDPASALPWSGMATSYTFLGALGQLPSDEAFPEGERAALRALELEDSLGESHLALAAIQLFWHWDFEAAYRSFQKALGLTPGSAETHHVYSLYLRAVGDMEGMIEEVETALALDPLSLAINHSVAEAYFAARRDDDATAQLRRTLDLDPSFRAALETLGWVQTRAGHFDEALRSFELMGARSPNRYSGAAGRGYVLARLGRQEESREVLALLEERRRTEPRVLTAIDTATVHLGMGELDAVFEDIGRAVDARAGQTVFLRTERQWDDLRPDPRFARLLARIAPSSGEPV